MTKGEKAWIYVQSFMSLLDVVIAAAFIYVGFVVFKEDRAIDPIAWQLAFGIPAFLLIVKAFLVLFDVQKGTAGWLGLAVATSAGLLYGCINR